MIVFYILIIIFGLIAGSFISALTFRFPKGISVLSGKSFCDICKVKISWYDNIPLLSFLLLKGKCRNCKNVISKRYPLIEITTALIFTLLFFFVNNCPTLAQQDIICDLPSIFGKWTLPYLFLISVSLISIFVIDFEERIIPDDLVFINFALTFFVLILSSKESLFINIGTAFAASLFFLILHLITAGRGMGLGDVKLALFGGLFFGWPHTLTWLYLSVLIGALVGIILIFMKKAKFGKQIAFGPFLVISFFITLIWGEQIKNVLFLYI